MRTELRKHTLQQVVLIGFYAQTQLNNREDISIKPGRVTGISQSEGSVKAEITYDSKITESSYDYIIVATGFDQLKLFRNLASIGLKEKIATKALIRISNCLIFMVCWI